MKADGYRRPWPFGSVTTSVPPCQPHGFLNLDFPASAEVYDAAGRWLRDVLAATG